MNRVFHTIWNHGSGTWTAVSELALAQGKRNSEGRGDSREPAGIMRAAVLSVSPIALSMALFNPSLAYAQASNTGNNQGFAIGSATSDGQCVAIGGSGSFGATAVCSGADSLAVGNGAQGTAQATIALGASARASNAYATAIGDNANASGAVSSAIGSFSNASGDRSFAGGANASASGASAVAIGNGAVANAAGSSSTLTDNWRPDSSLRVSSFVAGNTAVGASATSNNNGTAVGNSAQATGSTSFAGGSGAVASGRVGVAVGGGSLASGDSAVSIGNTSTASGAQGIALGAGAHASGIRSASLGVGAFATGNQTIAIGNTATASGTGDTAIGNAAQATGGSSFAGGNGAIASAVNAVALGNAAQATMAGALALGNTALANQSNAIAFGAAAQAVHANSVALGANAQTAVGAQTNYTAFALSALQNSVGEVSVGSAGNERTITNVAAGVNGTDAVNVNQLSAINNKFTALQQDALLWDPAANGGAGAFSANHLGAGPNKITNVAAGTLSAGSTDAVNGSQLFATNTNVTNLGNLIGNLVGDGSNGAGVKYVRTNDTGLAPDDAHASAQGATAVGYNAQASAANAVALGNAAAASVLGGVALGSGSISNRTIATSNGSIPVGATGIPYNTADQLLLGAISVGGGGTYRQIINVADGTQDHDAVTLRQLRGSLQSFATSTTKYFHANSSGADSLAIGTDSVAVGPNTVVNGNNGIGIGNGAVVDMAATGGMAIGQNAQSLQADAMALGNGAIAGGAQSIAQGANANASGGASIALGSGATASHADSIALGSGSATTVGAQAGYIAYALAAAQTSAGEVNIGNRKITGVAAGSADTDAVNVSQLKALAASIPGGGSGGEGGGGGMPPAGDLINNAVGQAKQYTDSQINNLRGDLDKYRHDANGGTASALAVAGLPQPGAPGKSMLSIAGSTYEGQTGLALGLSTYTENGRWIVKAAATTNSRGKTGAAVGAGFQW
ncbi:YadA-like family protein [Herbaspirillum sp.]|uniref:YadA-like family protein n=1 Tax=Herbaspirillum sp. TaxID=1890675 RepID=UPI0031DF9430